MATKKDLKLDYEVQLPVDVQTKVYGEPFNPIKEKVAIVELSATWCGPCIRAVPHLVQLQANYPNIKILSIFACAANQIKAKLDAYNVNYVVSQISRERFSKWCDALDTQGIPHAAILVNGVVVFAGHPMQPDFAAAVAKYAKTE
eukprot:UN02749